MMLKSRLKKWTELVEEDWDDEVIAQIPALLDALETGEAFNVGLPGMFSRRVVQASVVAPHRLAAVAATLASIVDKVVANQVAALATHRSKYGFELSADSVIARVQEPMGLGNLVECAGASLAESTRATIAGWIPTLQVRRDAPRASTFWTVAFLALAIGERTVYRRFTGVPNDQSTAFQASETFGFNLQGLVAHLAGAIEHGASVENVMPAFDEVIANFENHVASESADLETLLAIARVVYHRIGRAPLGSVAASLRAKLIAAAEAE